jgi:hypothetical protein
MAGKKKDMNGGIFGLIPSYAHKNINDIAHKIIYGKNEKNKIRALSWINLNNLRAEQRINAFFKKLKQELTESNQPINKKRADELFTYFQKIIEKYPDEIEEIVEKEKLFQTQNVSGKKINNGDFFTAYFYFNKNYDTNFKELNDIFQKLKIKIKKSTNNSPVINNKLQNVNQQRNNMIGGRFFGLIQNKPIFAPEYNTHLKTIKNLSKRYNSIDPSKISVNNLNTKVKSFNKFTNKIINNSFQPLLEQLKLQLIEKIKLSLREFISTKFIYDYTIPFPELLDQLLDKLKEFDKLLNLLKLLDNQSDLSYYNYNIESFLYVILGKYEEYIEQILHRNPNIDMLQQLNQQVQDYIREYSEFIESMTNNRKRNNPIYELIKRLKNISDKISIKISLLSQNGNHLSNEMKRRRNLLYGKYQNVENYNRILLTLHKKYKNNSGDYKLKNLSELAKIGSKIESISGISNMNENDKKIMLKDLRETIIRLKNSLRNYPEFQEYESIIIHSQ